MDDEKIVKGFNAGYEIAQKDLILAKTLAESYKGQKTDFLLSFTKGIEEYEIEKSQKIYSGLDKDRNKQHDELSK